MWNLALSGNWVVALYRDEVLYIHSYIQSFFEGIKGYGKKVSEVKEYYNAAVQNSPAVHRERRNFLRSALRELSLLCSDQPGILGPKALFVFMGLCFARDEMVWMIQHHENPPIRQSKAKTTEDLVDRYVPELLFYMEELRGLVRKYSQVIQRYYVQYLAGYDAVALKQALQGLQHLSENDSIILSSICQTISDVSVKNQSQEVPLVSTITIQSGCNFANFRSIRWKILTISSTFGACEWTGPGCRATSPAARTAAFSTPSRTSRRC